MTTVSNIKYYHILGLLILIYLIIFLKLDSFHMRWWDESMFAVNTYEMMNNGKYFSLYFDNAPDLFNTKPPLSIWLQLIFVKAFGYNELAIRLPSAIASALTVIFLFIFIAKNYSFLLAWISSLILLTSIGFINFHTARTADSDSLLTLFLVLANIYFLKFILDHNKKNILIFLIFISLAFATKMYAALLFTPAYLFILIQNKKTKEFVLNKFFISGSIFLLLTSFGLIYLREIDTPGYIQQILFKDAGRIFSIVENHSGPPIFYLENLFKTRFSIWAVFLVVGSVFSFNIENKADKKLLINFLILSLTYLIVISSSTTKLEWYDMPLYPFLSVIAAYPIFVLLKTFNPVANINSHKKMFLLVSIFFLYPYYIMFDKSQGNTIQNGEKVLESNERFIFKKNKEKKDLNGIKVYYSGYNGSLLFYKYKLNEINQKIELNNSGQFNLNDKILVSSDSLINQLQKKYEFSVIDKFDKAQMIQINKLL